MSERNLEGLLPDDTLVIDDTSYPTKLTASFRSRKKYKAPDPRLVHAFIPGKILEIQVANGQKVKWGDPLLVLEAMKMKNDVTAPHDGVIKAVHVNAGNMVTKNQLLVELE